MKLAAALLPIFLAGCVTAELAPPLARPLSERASVTADDGLDLAELRDGLDLAERAYLARFPGPPPRVRSVHFHDGLVPRSLRPGLPKRAMLRGLCRWGPFGSRINLAVLLLGSVPAACHELHHARIGDPDHRDPSWRRVDGLRYGL